MALRIGKGASYDSAMALRVVGAGHGRTGTYSLKLALERLLGGRCHHMAEILAGPEHHLPLWAPVLRGEEVDWEDVFAGYVAQTDFPGAAFWRELSAVFPDALVVLSTRPSEDWYRSAASTIFQLDSGSSPFSEIWRERFGFHSRFDDPEAMITAYEWHNASVRSSVPPNRLLECTLGDGWPPLCDRLGVPVPDEPFPWTNTTIEFRATTVWIDPHRNMRARALVYRAHAADRNRPGQRD
jgi:Sulfotransferase domain